jgi:hypothetical protein
MLDRSHRTESNDSIQPLSHALIGGVQPKYGWWAPVAALYKEVGAGAHSTRFVGVASCPTNIPIQYRISARPREALLPPHTHARATLCRHGQWIEFLEPRCRLSLSLSDLPLSLRYVKYRTDLPILF